MDKNDLNKYFQAFKQDIVKNVAQDWQTVYLNSKENLILPSMSRKNIVKMGTKVFSIFVENVENGEKVINRLRPMS